MKRDHKNIGSKKCAIYVIFEAKHCNIESLLENLETD